MLRVCQIIPVKEPVSRFSLKASRNLTLKTFESNMAALNFSIGEFPFLQLADYYIVAKTANGFQNTVGAHDPNPILRPFAILSSIGMLE